ncbi:MAG: SAM-dependent methyltransferase [Hyphomicrobiales bacterium]|nr:MAG: SAM-dependent methyltransferase [Hyphomicrobiales bacterium]
MTMPDTNKTPHEFWEEIYQGKSPLSGGKPSAILEKYIFGREPGIALDLGCAKGDDAVWLASQRWQVTAVDISPTALGYAKINAERSGVADKITFKQYDLAKDFPEIQCDLVTVMFLQTPFDFPRVNVWRRAAACLRPRGLLLIATHSDPVSDTRGELNKRLPTAHESLDQLNLAPSNWREIFVGSIKRKGVGPHGRDVTVIDTIIAIERR